MGKVEIKYAEDYVDEMLEYFPDIQRSSMLKMIKIFAKVITVFMRSGAKMFKIRSKSPLVESVNKIDSISIHRIYGRKHLNTLRKQERKKKMNYGKEK